MASPRMFALTVGAVLVFASSVAVAQSVYASRVELAEELQRRRSDFGRAEERLAVSEAARKEASAAVAESSTEAERTETEAAERAAMLYRLTRRGTLVRYLLGSSSPIELLRRLGFLRHLSLQGLEERRRAGLGLAQAEEQLAAASRSCVEARSMLDELGDVVAELEKELDPGLRGLADMKSRQAAPLSAQLESDSLGH